MKKGLLALTIVMVIVFVLLIYFSMKLDMRPQDFIDHIFHNPPIQLFPEKVTEPPEEESTDPEDTVPEETTRPNNPGPNRDPVTEPTEPTEPEEPTVPDETVENDPTELPTEAPAPGYEEDDWETPEF